MQRLLLFVLLAFGSEILAAEKDPQQNAAPTSATALAPMPPQWKDQAPTQLKGLRITLSEPVLVKRSRWYCWFPSLISLKMVRVF